MLSALQTDKSLVRQTLGGNRDAFARLVERHLPAVHAVAFAISRNHADAEDAVQDAFLKAFESLPTLREPNRFGPWVTNIARNLCRDRWRANQRRQNVSEDERSAPDPGAQAAQQERHDMIRAQLNELDETSREILVLYYYAGRNTREIANILDINTAAAKKRLERARANLGKQLLADLRQSPDFKEADDNQLKRVLLALAATTPAWFGTGAGVGAAAGTAVGLGATAKAAAGVAIAAAAVATGVIAFGGDDANEAAANVEPQSIAVASALVQNETPDTAEPSNNPMIAEAAESSEPKLQSADSKEDVTPAASSRPLYFDTDKLEQLVRKPLESKASIAFENERIESILEFIGEYLHLNVVVLPPPDQPKASGAGPLGPYATDGIVRRINVYDTPLHEVLSEMLLPLGLDYAVEPGYIWVSTPDRIRAEIEEASKAEYDKYRERALLDVAVSISFSREHIESILDFISEYIEMNFVVDYRVVPPPGMVNLPKPKATRSIGRDENDHVLRATLDHIQQTADGLYVRLAVGEGDGKWYGVGDVLKDFTVESIDAEAKTVTLRNSETGETIQLEDPVYDTWPPEPLDLKPVEPGIVPYISIKGVAIEDILRGMLRFLDYDYKVMPGYIAVGPSDALSVYDGMSNRNESEYTEQAAALLESDVTLVYESGTRLTSLMSTLEGHLQSLEGHEDASVRPEPNNLRFETMPAVQIGEEIPLAAGLDAVLTPMNLQWRAEGGAIVIEEAEPQQLP